LAAAVALAGCYSTGEIRAQNEVVRHQIDNARRADAYRCAPQDLAQAEANYEFSEQELRDGHSIASHQFSLLAQASARDALQHIRECPALPVPDAGAPAPVPVVDAGVPDAGVPDAGAKDTDGDGIPDDVDRCPTLPGPPENFGCPWGDRDKDGVPDNVDACPDVPGIPELKGCPDVDTDKDGIPDRLDKCPTVPGVPPDGCPKKYSLVTVRADRIEIRQQIRFAANKSTILRPSFALLNQVAAALRDSPQIKIRIEGHTDNSGVKSKNQKLSQARAQAVMAYLVDHGIDEARLGALGFGSSRPLASNSTKAGKALNRRVEFKFVGQPLPAPPDEGTAPAP
jgi:OOP family OmpA-OmpF porin